MEFIDQKEVKMIEPKTSAGEQLKAKYEQKIADLKKQGGFARSGPDSFYNCKQDLIKKYNSTLSQIESLNPNEANAVFMHSPTTTGGEQLKAKYEQKIADLKKQGGFARSGPDSFENQKEKIIKEYNGLLAAIE